MSISWGRRTRLRFDSAGAYTGCKPPGVPAIYALTYKQDEGARPKAHTVVYFGETADLSMEMDARCKQLQEVWLNNGGREGSLYVFYHPMPSSTLWQRTSILSQLISEYDPPLNNDN